MLGRCSGVPVVAGGAAALRVVVGGALALAATFVAGALLGTHAL